MPDTTPDAALRQRVEALLDDCRTLIPSAMADVLLPLIAAEREAGREAGLREGAAALQARIDRDKAQFPRLGGQSRIALGGARQILLDLIAHPAQERR